MNGTRRRGRKELAGLVEARDRLDEDRAIDAGRGQLGGEILRPEPPVDRRELRRQPRVRRAGRVQQVMVGVDDRGHGGVGRVGGDQALGPQVVPQGRRDPPAHERRVLVEMLDAPHAGDQPGNGGMGQRELDRGGAQRDSATLAGLGQPPGAIEDLGAGRAVVEVGTGSRVGQDPAVHHAADEHRDPALDAQRQELRKRVLVEQRVPTGDEERVHLGLPGEPDEHRRLLDPDADRPDDALLAQPMQRRIGARRWRPASGRRDRG